MPFFKEKVKETYLLLFCKKDKYGQWGELKIFGGGVYKEREFTELFTGGKNTELTNLDSIWRKMKRKKKNKMRKFYYYRKR
jgi:hypothetical protein